MAPNTFCRYLSNGYSFNLDRNNTLTVAPCCWFSKSLPVDSNLIENRKIFFESITNWTPNCEKCKQLEKNGQQSLRQAGPDWIPDDVNNNSAVSIDVRLDDECNAACVICNSYNSTLWAKENIKKQNKKIVIVKKKVPVENSIKKIVNEVDLSQVRYVKFYGGEPLFTDTHLKFLAQIPNPQQVTVHYTTNGSIYPNSKVLAMWKKFKTIIFAASLDGINEQFDYVRWPLKWHKVEKNLLKIKHNKNIRNLVFRVEFTANLLNTYYFDKLESWVEQHLPTNQWGDKTDVNLHVCFGNGWDLDNMPDKIKKLIYEKYPVDHLIYNLVKNLDSKAVLNLQVWQMFIDTWDKKRKNSWQQAFPDLVNCMY